MNDIIIDVRHAHKYFGRVHALNQDQTLHEFVARPCVSASRAFRARLSHSSAVKVQNAQFMAARCSTSLSNYASACQPLPSSYLKLDLGYLG